MSIFVLIINTLRNNHTAIIFRSVLLLVCSICALPTLVFAQTKVNRFEIKNNPKKYDSHFEGIGPKVYIIPPPKTEKEVITDRYALKKKEHSQVESLLLKLSFTKQLKKFKTFLPAGLTDSLKNKDEEQQLIAGIDYYKKEDNKAQLALWQNNLAVLYITSEKYDEACALLIEASENQEELGTLENRFTVLNNLTQLELTAENSIKALSFYDKLLARAKNSKDINYQTLSYIAIAKLEAQLGNFTDAHNSIIKRSMPLLQRTKNYPRIVTALNYLASFKELQKQETEARWIYLQAVDVAKSNKDEDGLAISFFNLAQLKNRIGEETLAIADYKLAKEIALKNKMDSLLIVINDGMGDAYLKLNDFKAATLLLNEYQLLKLNLLNQNYNL